MLPRQAAVITSVEPLEGQEGTVVTLYGSGFAPHFRNNCVVIGGMGACARPEPGSTPTALKVRIGPVAQVTSGETLMWPGTATDLYVETIEVGDTSLHFSEASLFRNGAPVSAAGIDFKLTQASPDTYGGYFEESVSVPVDLGGHENGSVMRARFPGSLSFPKHSTVDICLVLKEPTLAVDFTAAISGRATAEEALRAIAKSIVTNAGLIGEKVFANVVRDPDTGDYDLYVTKPYLSNGMFTVHFGSNPARPAVR